MAGSEQYSLRWNNFHSNLASGFHQLLAAADLVDVTLAVEGQLLHAHKLVLSICSPYFKEMFKKHPCQHPIIILKDVAYAHLKDILEFVYLGEVNVHRENLTNFLQTAELLQIKGLSCEDTQSNQSFKEADPKTEILADVDPNADEAYSEENHHLPAIQVPLTQTVPTTNKRSRTAPISVAKKTKSESSSNKSQKQSNDVILIDEDMVKTEPIRISEELASLENEPLQTDLKASSDSGVGFMNNVTNPSDGAAQDQDVIMFAIDEKGHVYCPYCYKKFVNRYNLKVHIRDKHDSRESNLDCVICKKTMRNKSCLRVHMYHHRKQAQLLENESSCTN